MSVGVSDGALVAVGLDVSVGAKVEVKARVAIVVRVSVGDEVRNGVSLAVSVGATVGVTSGTDRLQAAIMSASSAKAHSIQRLLNRFLLITLIINRGRAMYETGS